MYIFKRHKFERGFTLVEVVISSLIIGIILSSIFYALGFLNINLDRLSKNHKNYEKFLTTLSIIEQDLKTLSSRSIRDEYGDYQPSLVVSNTNDKKIIFSRTIFNELDHTQYTYRIEYDFSNQQLKRNIWNVLDRIQNSNYQTHTLDENILDFSVSITDYNMQWHQSWPIGYIIDNSSSQSSSIGLTTRNDIEAYQNLITNKSKNERLPLAFKIIIKHKYYGDIERVILSQI